MAFVPVCTLFECWWTSIIQTFVTALTIVVTTSTSSLPVMLPFYILMSRLYNNVLPRQHHCNSCVLPWWWAIIGTYVYSILCMLHWNILHDAHGANYLCTDVHTLVLEICMHKVFALYMCVVSSWCGRPKSISWGGKTRRWQSARYAAVSEVLCPPKMLRYTRASSDVPLFGLPFHLDCDP